MKNNAVLEEAVTWLKTPYHHKAMVKLVGVDCAHFLIGVYSKVYSLPPIAVEDYPADWHLHQGGERFLAYIKEHCSRVYDPQPGDIAMFKFGRCVSHGSIVVEWPRIIHSYYGQGVVYASANDAALHGRVHSFWRVEEVG